MTKQMETREAVENLCLQYADNCVYNYVTILTWLRVIRYWKGFLLLCPIFIGAVASWLGLTNAGGVTISAFFSILAGLFSTLYIATGIEERILYYKRLCGRYRAIGSEFRNLGQVGRIFSDRKFETKFEENFKAFKDIREEAYTLPKWCYRKARKEIDSGNYNLLVGNDS